MGGNQPSNVNDEVHVLLETSCKLFAKTEKATNCKNRDEICLGL